MGSSWSPLVLVCSNAKLRSLPSGLLGTSWLMGTTSFSLTTVQSVTYEKNSLLPKNTIGWMAKATSGNALARGLLQAMVEYCFTIGRENQGITLKSEKSAETS